MPNDEHLKILNQGVEVWNGSRAEYVVTEPELHGADLVYRDLRGANLTGADLTDVDLGGADLTGADLGEANLRGAKLSFAGLERANLGKAILEHADLRGANLEHAVLAGVNLRKGSLKKANLYHADVFGAILVGANLYGATLIGTSFREADLRNTRLVRAELHYADLTGAKMAGATLNHAQIGHTIFGDSELRDVKGLASIQHWGPSTIGIDTIYKSEGQIPESFLRGCGLSDADIEYAKLARPGLTNEEVTAIGYRIIELRATQAIQISPLFISYSTKDSGFVDTLEGHLNTKGIRFWRDIHDAVAGRLENQIDQAIRQNPTFLLVLSERSVESDWVEHEVRKARELEKDLKRDVICPIALDAS